jgi:hypothetical protein
LKSQSSSFRFAADSLVGVVRDSAGFPRSKPSSLLGDLPSDCLGHLGADADDPHGILDEAELDVLAGR